MTTQSLYILDVFAEQKYAGNQLAVVRNASILSDEQMQKIAKEMNYSETTFILNDESRDKGYDVRIFTPAAEVPFAGHPTIGTAFVVRHEIIKRTVEQVILNLKVGQVHVSFEKDILWMKPKETIFGETFEPEEILQFLTVGKEDIDNKFPIQHVSIGIDFVFVPLKSLDAVKKASIVKGKLFDWLRDKQIKCVFVFCSETYSPQNDMNVRLFADCLGITEDPATGSANSCLASYLVKHRYFGKKIIDIRVEQGYEINRPSLLYLRAEENDEKIDVSVGGKVKLIAKGELI